MKKSLREIAELINGEVDGKGDVVITGVSGIKEAKKGDITFVANPKYLSLLNSTRASAVIVSKDVERANNKVFIRTDNPYLAFTKVMELLVTDELPLHPKGIHPSSIVGENVKLGKNVALHAYVVIENNARIGDNVTIYPHVYVGYASEIGDNSVIYPDVTIRERVKIGSRVIIHSGAKIGCDGFGFAPLKGVHHKVPQTGTVIIEDDVEIGANTTVDRATLGITHIKKGTKIDNLVQIAHNVVVGENAIIVAQVGISGSTTIGRGVTIAGQAGVAGHLKIGDNTVIAGKAGVTKSVGPDLCVSGFPAVPHEREKKVKACIRRLPELHKAVRGIEKRLSRLEKALDEQTEDDS